MLIPPEARTAILRVSAVAAIDVLCIIGAVRVHRRWTRIILVTAALPITLATLFGILVIDLIIRYGPR
jgi:hypothetical protein